jgi:hypothetical protein
MEDSDGANGAGSGSGEPTAREEVKHRTYEKLGDGAESLTVSC